MNSDSELLFPWSELGLAPTRDIAEIQRAYARRLKTIDLGSERDAFQALRRAYEAALVAAASGAEPEPAVAEGSIPEPPPAPPPPPVRSEPLTAIGDVDLAWLRAFLDEFTAQGKARDVSGAMAELDRFLRAAPLSIELQGELEVRLFGIVMDDPDMPVELLTELAKHFRWSEIGSGLEVNRPDLYARFLYRQSSAFEWLQRVQALRASGPRQGWLQRSRLLGLGAATPAYAAYLVLARYDWRFAVFGVFYDPNALDTLLRQARRFGPLLGDVLDPRMIEFVWRHSKRLKANRGSVRKVIVVMASVSVAILGLAYIADYTGVIGRWQTLSVSTAVLPIAESGPDARSILERSPEDWIHFASDGRQTLVTFTFMQARSVIAEIRYGLDTPTPDQIFPFPPTDDPWPANVPAGFDPFPSIGAPIDLRFVSLQLRFKDGTLSAIQTYTVPPE